MQHQIHTLSLSTICQFCFSLQIHSSVVSPDLLHQLQQREEKPVVPRHHELLIIIFACDESQKKALNFAYQSSATNLGTIFCKSAVNPFLQMCMCRGTTNKQQNSRVFVFCKFLLLCTNIDGSTQHLQSSS